MPAVVGASQRLPRISKKTQLHVQQLKGLGVFLVDGLLTRVEAERLVAYAETKGFDNHSSRGPAHGEVSQA